MKSTPLIINWHDQNAPIYSAHFDPSGKGRLATAGGDNNVRLWKLIEGSPGGEDLKVEYRSTLTKHTQAVNVVRWSPRGDMLASAGDDGNVILWVQAETQTAAFGSDGLEDKETWRARHMCRSSGAEIYDLAWSPQGSYFIIGSMDNIARIYSSATGYLVRQIAEHSHYVQGVTWDPLDEFIATQSSDRSVHIYSLKTKDGQYTLTSHEDLKPAKLASHNKADLPPRRISSNSPAPPDFGVRSQLASIDALVSSAGSPVPSAPGTPTSMPLPMNPPSVISHSRRSSFSSRRSVSPAPSMPLPAVMPMEPSPKQMPPAMSLGVKNAHLYANETLTSFFRRLTFAPDGSLLLTPSGQYQSQQQAGKDAKPSYEVINTVYIYTRAGINKPPIAHLPGHKKPSVAVRFSPVFYSLRTAPAEATKNLTIDTSSPDDTTLSLPEPVAKPASPAPGMDPPPPPSLNPAIVAATPNPAEAPTSNPKQHNVEAPATPGSSSTSPGPKPAFSLPYRMVYAVATQDSVIIYDTQQQTPICVVTNLHCATFTDLSWSPDGLTLLITSSDGFCSTLSFTPGELGQVYSGEIPSLKQLQASTSAPSQATPVATSPFHGPHHQQRNSTSSFTAPSPPALAASFVSMRPSSPARSNSTSSIATQSSAAPGVMTNPPLIVGSVPGLVATSSGKVTGVPMTTPPETPRHSSASTGTKRDASESEKEEPKDTNKKRRIAPTPVGPETKS